MKLIRWLQEHKVTDEAFAALVGGCTAAAVRKWKYGERQPTPATIVKIETITGGQVTLRDLVREAGSAS